MFIHLSLLQCSESKETCLKYFLYVLLTLQKAKPAFHCGKLLFALLSIYTAQFWP